MSDVGFDPEICITCETVDCLMRCQYLGFSDVAEAKKEREAINAGKPGRVLEECYTCYSCQEYCPRGNNPFFFLVEQQEKLGILPSPVPVVEEQLAMMAPRGRIQPMAIDGTIVDMCAFPMLTGCVRPPLFENASPVTGTDIFCNIMWLHFAKNSVIRERLPGVIENIVKNYLEPSGANELVCFHDECYGTFTKVAPAFGIEVPFVPVHLFDYIRSRLDKLALQIRKLDVKIAYQRPCSNRLIPETDEVLDEIFRMIGADRVKRTYDRENALCCGGVIRAHQKEEEADRLVDENIADMKATGAAYVVFNCPFCMATLAEIVVQEGMIPILVSDLVMTALGG